MGWITAHSNPYSSFSLSSFSLCVQRGFDEKILLSAVQYSRRVEKWEGLGCHISVTHLEKTWIIELTHLKFCN